MNLFAEDVPNGLPPTRRIEHQIHIMPSASIPNKSAFGTSLKETKELQRQVEELLEKGLVEESMTPCAVLVLFVLKKEGSWRICIDCRVINNITLSIIIPSLNSMICLMTCMEQNFLPILILKAVPKTTTQIEQKTSYMDQVLRDIFLCHPDLNKSMNSTKMMLNLGSFTKLVNNALLKSFSYIMNQDFAFLNLPCVRFWLEKHIMEALWEMI
uniref:Reverse transcriptase domain-containing protein n=1 Tax=Lactuca sativa TaxID=4236 RepID=A0A9R1URQ7_LACSA|nr:hypothetical protein LSAT_V11C800446320 [Lactuca sativa]